MVVAVTEQLDIFGRKPVLPDTRLDEIDARFIRFHGEHSEVWEYFVRYVRDLMRAGFDRYSADAILHRIRWHRRVEKRDRDFALNNDHTACYARMWRATYPEHADFFEVRERTSARRKARGGSG